MQDSGLRIKYTLGKIISGRKRDDTVRFFVGITDLTPGGISDRPLTARASQKSSEGFY